MGRCRSRVKGKRADVGRNGDGGAELSDRIVVGQDGLNRDSRDVWIPAMGRVKIRRTVYICQKCQSVQWLKVKSTTLFCLFLSRVRVKVKKIDDE